MTDLPHFDLRRLLYETPLTDREIAEAAGVSRKTVYRWKLGRSQASRAEMRAVVQAHHDMIADVRPWMNNVTEAVDRRPARG